MGAGASEISAMNARGTKEGIRWTMIVLTGGFSIAATGITIYEMFHLSGLFFVPYIPILGIFVPSARHPL